MTPSSELDVLCVGNAIVDIFAQVDEAFIGANDLEKGSMTLVDEDRSASLYAMIPSPVERSGGSAGNTAAGVAKLGGKAAYIGKVYKDTLGDTFASDIRSLGVTFQSEPATSGARTATSMIFITPDAERTMNTFLGACGDLTPADIDPELVSAAKVTYLEGYLWDRPTAKDAFREAIKLAHAAGNKTSITLSDAFCVGRFRDEFLALLHNKEIDILFANEEELLSLYETDDFDVALAKVQKDCPLSAVTRGEKGCVIVNSDGFSHVAGETVVQLVDTTGAGDLFAAGFLAGYTQGKSLIEAAELGNEAAAKVIQHVGARLV